MTDYEFKRFDERAEGTVFCKECGELIEPDWPMDLGCPHCGEGGPALWRMRD